MVLPKEGNSVHPVRVHWSLVPQGDQSQQVCLHAIVLWSLMAETSVIGGDHQHLVPHHQGVGHQVAMLAWFPMGMQVLIHDSLVVLLHTENS
jgi:hypothetical protein